MKVLVVGFGSIARKHLDNLRHCYPKAELAVWCRPGIDRPNYGLSGLFFTAEAAKAWQPNFIIVASPASYHAEHVAAMAMLGIPMLIEKPLAADLQQGLWIIKSLSGRGRLGYQLRYTEGFSRMTQWLPSLGKLLYVRLEVGQYLPSWRPGTPVSEMVSARPELGGGALLELSHELDLLFALLGLPQSVRATSAPSSHLRLAVEECVELTLRYADGPLVQLHLDMLQYHPCRQSKWLGDEGQIEWDLLANRIIQYGKDGHPERELQGQLTGQQIAQRQLQAFIEGEPGGARVVDGVPILHLITAAKQSLASGEEVFVHGC